MEFCTLASGSTGNSQYIGTKHIKLLIDAGVSGKYIESTLKNIGTSMSDVSAVLITHEHSDHIKGLGVLMRKYDIDVYINEATWEETKTQIGEVDDKRVHIFNTNQKFQIEDVMINPIAISHDAADPVSFSICSEDANICVATDMGVMNNDIVKQISDCDFLMIEANHDENMVKMGRYPYNLKRRILGDTGHISNETAGYEILKAAQHGRLSQVILGHLSRKNNFPELAYETINQILMDGQIELGRDINMDVAHHNRASRLYKFGKI